MVKTEIVILILRIFDKFDSLIWMFQVNNPNFFTKITFIGFNNRRWPSDKDRTIKQFHAVGSTTEEVLKEKFDFNFYNLKFS